jgi:hypothetical protein
MQELEEELGISADASGGAGLFSASERFNFAKTCKMQVYSVAILLQAVQRFGFKSIDAPAINGTAAPDVSNPTLFQDRYKDRFVRGIGSGGQFFGFIRIEPQE